MRVAHIGDFVVHATTLSSHTIHTTPTLFLKARAWLARAFANCVFRFFGFLMTFYYFWGPFEVVNTFSFEPTDQIPLYITASTWINQCPCLLRHFCLVLVLLKNRLFLLRAPWFETFVFARCRFCLFISFLRRSESLQKPSVPTVVSLHICTR